MSTMANRNKQPKFGETVRDMGEFAIILGLIALGGELLSDG